MKVVVYSPLQRFKSGGRTGLQTINHSGCTYFKGKSWVLLFSSYQQSKAHKWDCDFPEGGPRHHEFLVGLFELIGFVSPAVFLLGWWISLILMSHNIRAIKLLTLFFLVTLLELKCFPSSSISWLIELANSLAAPLCVLWPVCHVRFLSIKPQVG